MTRARLSLALPVACALFLGAAAHASTLHGRVKDLRCVVLSGVTVRIRSTDLAHGHDLRTLRTDSGGNYTAELPAGAYDLCLQQGDRAPECIGIVMPAAGDKFMTTQLHSGAPDLSGLGNRAE